LVKSILQNLKFCFEIKFLIVLFTKVEIQMFLALIIFSRWIIPKAKLKPVMLANLLFKYFGISCDMLDFLTILQDSKLQQNTQLTYWTLSIWSWSTFQFFIYVPDMDDDEKNAFHAYITNSLLGVLFLDLPYFGLRIAAIFALGKNKN
jgi:hypothetical protein